MPMPFRHRTERIILPVVASTLPHPHVRSDVSPTVPMVQQYTVRYSCTTRRHERVHVRVCIYHGTDIEIIGEYDVKYDIESLLEVLVGPEVCLNLGVSVQLYSTKYNIQYST